MLLTTIFFPSFSRSCTSMHIQRSFPRREKASATQWLWSNTCFQLQEKLPTNGCLQPKPGTQTTGRFFQVPKLAPPAREGAPSSLPALFCWYWLLPSLKSPKKDCSEWHVLLVYNSLHILVSISLTANSSIPVTLLSPVRLHGLLPCGSSHARSPAQKLILRTL